MIAIGDFFQLAPVPGPLKGDKGEYCFNSNMFRNTFKHCIFLHEVRRQSEIDFINCINEVSKGTVKEFFVTSTEDKKTFNPRTTTCSPLSKEI